MIRNEHRDGVFGYVRLNTYMTEISGLGLGDRKTKVMQPKKSKREEDIFQNILNWEEEIRELENILGCERMQACPIT